MSAGGYFGRKTRKSRPNLSIAIPPNEKMSAKHPPLLLQKYDLHETLGHGSVARVRRATLKTSDESSSVGQKSSSSSSQQFVIKTTMTDDPEMVLIAEKEFKFLKDLQHPNIVR